MGLEYLTVTASEFEDILSVFEDRGIEILHSVQDGEIRIYSHFDEVEDIIWAIQVINELDLVVQRAEVGTSVAGVRGGNGHDW